MATTATKNTAAKSATVKPMGKADLVEAVAKEANIGRTQAKAAVDALIDTITKELKKKGKVQITGFGTFAVSKRNPLLDVALELERIALEDDYFVSRKLYPNVDFYSGLIYEAMGLPMTMFPVMFAIPRTVGWLAQWQEMLEDKDQRIQRPRQIFLGERERDFLPMSKRG